MSRQAKIQHRETAILEATYRIGERDGLLGLRVADVAAEADVSIGVLYSHFPSKEDLIAGLAQTSWQHRRHIHIKLAQDERLAVAERLPAAIFADFLFSIDHPAFFLAEQVTSGHATWINLSPLRVQALRSAHESIVAVVTASARAAIESGAYLPWENLDRHASMIDSGVWTLMTGASHAAVALPGLYPERCSEEAIPDSLRHNCQSLLLGYGWRVDNPAATIKQIANWAIKHTRCKEIWPTKPVAPVAPVARV